jgi:acetyl esterase
MAACGIFQVSNVERLLRDASLHEMLSDWLTDMRDAYLAGSYEATNPTIALADPVCVLERGETPDRPLPPFFMPIGGGDLLVDDTRRLSSALNALGVANEYEVYAGEPHAFHMLTWRKASKQLWKDTFRFLSKHLPRTLYGTTSVAPIEPRQKRNWIERRILSAMAA